MGRAVLPNPYYVPELKGKTGLDEPVRDYVMNAGVTEEFWAKLTPVVDFCCRSTGRRGGRSWWWPWAAPADGTGRWPWRTGWRRMSRRWGTR